MNTYSARNVLIFINLLLFIWLHDYLTLVPVPSVDLPGHIALIEKLQFQLFQGNIEFYDRTWFGGFPAFEFYGFFAHLLTALIAYFGDAQGLSTEQTVSIIITILLILLPNNIYLLSKQLLSTYLDENKHNDYLEKLSPMLAIWCGVFTFWFLNSNYDNAGAGLAAIYHTGLYPQLFAWHLLLLSVTYLLSLKNEFHLSDAIKVIILISCLIITHPLTATYLYIFSFLLLLPRIKDYRFILTWITPILLTAIWWKDFFIYSGYRSNVIEGQGVSFFDICFNYGAGEILSNLLGLLTGQGNFDNWTFYLVWILALTAIFNPLLQRSKTNLYYIICIIAVIILAQFQSVVDILPVKIHIYRFHVYSLLILIPTLTCLGTVLFSSSRFSKYPNALKIAMITFVCLSVITTATNAPLEYKYSKSAHAKQLYYNEDRLIDYLDKHPKVTRVALEYFNDYSIFGFVSPHYITSKLSTHDIETVNGLLIQSSNVPIFTAVAASALGIDAYAPPASFYKHGKNINYALEIYQSLGVTHLVLSNPYVINKLRRRGDVKVKYFGQYALIQLSNESIPLIEVLKKEPLKINKDLAEFKIVQQRVIADRKSFATKEPIHKLGEQGVIFPSDQAPSLVWSNDKQSININNLEPGLLYRLNYTYLPKWRISGGKLYQGQSDRMIILAEERNDYSHI